MRQQATASAKATSQEEREEEVGVDDQMPLSSTRCDKGSDEGSDQDDSVQSDDGEEIADVSEGSDLSGSQDRLQGLDTMGDSLLEHSGTKTSS